MSKRKQAYLIIACSLAFIILIISAKFFLVKPESCNQKIDSKTVILIDHSEDVATQTIAEIVNRSMEFIESSSVKEGELISIFAITQESKKNLKPIFEGCKLRSEGNQAIENVKKVKRDFLTFKKNLEKELSVPIAGSNESPIAQALTDLSLDHRRFKSASNTNLIIFSDMMENTNSPKFTLYGCASGKDAIANYTKIKSGSQVRPKFENVEVKINLIPRKGLSKEVVSCRDMYWNWFFGDTTCKSSSCVEPKYLPG